MAASPPVLGGNQVVGPRPTTSPLGGGASSADLVGISPTMALVRRLHNHPDCLCPFLELHQLERGRPNQMGGSRQLARVLLRPRLPPLPAGDVRVGCVCSWLAQTPLAMALGIFVAGTQRYRAVYAAIYLVPLLLSTAGLSLMWQDVLFPQFGGLAWLGSMPTCASSAGTGWGAPISPFIRSS